MTEDNIEAMLRNTAGTKRFTSTEVKYYLTDR